jgi:hypothetical protein
MRPKDRRNDGSVDRETKAIRTADPTPDNIEDRGVKYKGAVRD